MEALFDRFNAVGLSLGVSGAGIGVAFLVYRDIIRKSIFPKLTRQQGFLLLSFIVLLTWSISVFGIYASFQPQTEPHSYGTDIIFDKDTGNIYCDRGNIFNVEFDERRYILLEVSVLDKISPSHATSIFGLPFPVDYGQIVTEADSVKRKESRAKYYECRHSWATSAYRSARKQILKYFESDGVAAPREINSFDITLYMVLEADYKNSTGVVQKRYFEHSKSANSNDEQFVETDERSMTEAKQIGRVYKPGEGITFGTVRWDWETNELSYNDIVSGFSTVIAELKQSDVWRDR